MDQEPQMHMEPQVQDLNKSKCSGGCGRQGQFATSGTFEGWRVIYVLCEFCLPRWEEWKAKMEKSTAFWLPGLSSPSPEQTPPA